MRSVGFGWERKKERGKESDSGLWIERESERVRERARLWIQKERERLGFLGLEIDIKRDLEWDIEILKVTILERERDGWLGI